MSGRRVLAGGALWRCPYTLPRSTEPASGQFTDHSGIVGGDRFSSIARATGGGHAGGAEDVLNRQGIPLSGPPWPFLRRVSASGLAQRAFTVQSQVGLDLGFHLVDAGKDGVGQGHRSGCTGVEQVQGLMES